MVDVAFFMELEQVETLEQIKNDRELEGIMVVKCGMRLSIQPVSQQHFKRNRRLAGEKRICHERKIG